MGLFREALSFGLGWLAVSVGHLCDSGPTVDFGKFLCQTGLCGAVAAGRHRRRLRALPFGISAARHAKPQQPSCTWVSRRHTGMSKQCYHCMQAFFGSNRRLVVSAVAVIVVVTYIVVALVVVIVFVVEEGIDVKYTRL